MQREYFTIPEVAQKLKVTRAAIYKWIAQGKIDVVYVGSDRRITNEAIEKFVRASTQEARGLDDPTTMEHEIQTPDLVGAPA